MKSLICLSFMQMLNTTQSSVPKHIDEMIKSKISFQFLAQYPGSSLSFDQDDCSQKGHYWYSSNGIVLEAENAIWNGRLEQSTADVLDGQKIHFADHIAAKYRQNPETAMEHVLMAHEAHQAELKKGTPSSQWLAWSLGTVALGVAGFFAYKHFSRKKSPASGSEPALATGVSF